MSIIKFTDEEKEDFAEILRTLCTLTGEEYTIPLSEDLSFKIMQIHAIKKIDSGLADVVEVMVGIHEALEDIHRAMDHSEE